MVGLNERMTNNTLTIHQLIIKYGLLHCGMKSLGQNFITDESLLDKIVHCALPIDHNFDIVEIGPGPTGLTRSILKLCPNKLICIEKDIRFKPIHDDLKCYYSNLEFIYDDALKIKLSKITKNKIVVIANLPYNVGTTMLMNWLINDIQDIDKFVLMFQQEVAERICAQICTKNYGKLSVLSQLLCETSKLFNISNKSFIPQPKVTSAVVLLKNRYLKFDNLPALIKLLDICFQRRRKMIGPTLNKMLHINNIDEILSKCNITPSQRPESITPQQFLTLSEMIMTL